MTDIRKCAQAVVARYDNALEIDTHCDLAGPIEALRQALAEPVEPVGVVATGKNGITRVNWSKYLPDDGTKLYTAPPSVDALIAEAVAKEREACAELCEYLDARWGIDSFLICAEAIRARGQK